MLIVGYRIILRQFEKSYQGLQNLRPILRISTSEQAPVINGFTGDQRFFLAYAQVWRTIYREQTLRQQLIRGPHSPPFYRVNGIVRNLDEWYQAVDVGPEHRLYLPPEERIRIW